MAHDLTDNDRPTDLGVRTHTAQLPAQASPNKACFDRTIDRRLVHRSALAEVFVTDTLTTGQDTFAVWGQLPRSHAYYGDHFGSSRHDPVLLLEFVRQAALAGAHAYAGVPFEDKFILTHQRLTLLRPNLLAVGVAPGLVSADFTCANRQERDGALTGVDHGVEIHLGDHVVATAEIGLRFRSPSAYAALRLRGRDGLPPGDTSQLVPGRRGHQGVPVTAALVARYRPENVLLCNARIGDRLVSAGLEIAHDHPSLFDHPQDHLPGMVLVEAARQLAVLAAGDFFALDPDRVEVIGVDATYSRFGELEPETLLHSRPLPADPADPAGRGPDAGTRRRIGVQVTQRGVSIATIEIVLGGVVR